MIHVCYSNRSEALLEALRRDLAARRAKAGPFEPARLVVPNHNVETWLRFQLARRDGIAANLQVHLLRRFMAGLLEGPDRSERVLDAEALRDGLLGLLLDEDFLRGPKVAAVSAYLRSAGDSPDAIDLRRHQLALQLAQLFEEYGFSRPEMLAAWPKGPVFAGTPAAGVEDWQRELWLELTRAGGRLERQGARLGVRFITLAEAVEKLPALDSPVRLFGVSYVAPVFHRALAKLSRQGELYVYTLNPCAEFWEDVPAGWETRLKRPRRAERLEPAALELDDPFGLSSPEGPAPLALWGRPGRENVRLLNQLAECDFRDAFEDPVEAGGTSLLHLVQRDILRCAPPRETGTPEELRLPADGSLRVLACPNARREAETVAGEIWKLVRADEGRPGDREPLRFNDIAVLVAGSDPSAYFAHLSAAFQETYGIPFTLSDASLESGSPVVQAVQQLLQLPHGRFRRAEILRLASHPCVRSCVPDANPESWVAWCEAAGIVHGADRADHDGTYVDGDLLSWDQGLRRLALGAVMAGARSGTRSPVEIAGGRYLPEEQGASPEAAAFGLLARSLMADARFARSARLSMSDWADLFEGLISSYVTPRDEGESRALEKCRRALRSLADLWVEGRKVSCRLATALAQSAIGGIAASSGQYLAGGVVVSSLQPMRALPFRAVFVVGLAEGAFPAADRRSNLDLREARKRAGDVSSRERDQYLFLETLLGARERLCLSYVARDALTGDAVEPSPVVLELTRMLQRGYLSQAAGEDFVEAPPLRRWDARLIPDPGSRPVFPVAPGAQLDASARAARAGLMALGTAPSLSALREALPAEQRRALERLAGAIELPPKKAPAPDGEERLVRLPLNALRRFLECPLQASAETSLHLEQDQEGDPAELEDEAFETDALRRADLLKKTFVERMFARVEGRPAPTLEALYDREADLRRLSGQAPLGVFSEVERDAHLSVLAAWEAELDKLPEEARRPEIVRFGGTDEAADAQVIADPITFSLAAGETHLGVPVKVQLHGRTNPLLADRSRSLVLGTRSARRSDQEPLRAKRDSLRGFVDALALSASGLHEGPFAVQVLRADGACPLVEWSGFGSEEALATLRSLAAELLRGAHAYLLPCEAVFAARQAKLAAAGPGAEERADEPASHLAEAVEDVMSAGLAASTFGPVRRPADSFAPPPEAEGWEMVARRFGLYFERLIDPAAPRPETPPDAEGPKAAKARGTASKAARKPAQAKKEGAR